MARNHARVMVSIWTDPDFRALSVEAQRMYVLLLSQGSLNNAGVLPLTVKRWAAGCHATTPKDVEKALGELDEHRYVVVDEDTEEVLIRSFIRNDGIVSQPQMLKNALRQATTVESVRLRSTLARELRRLGREDASATADELDPTPTPGPSGGSPIQAPRSLPEGSPQGSRTPSGVLHSDSPQGASGVPHSGSPQGAELRRGRGRGSSSSSVGLNSSSALDERFNEFYDAYPRKKDRRKAEQAYRAAIKRKATPDQLLAAAKAYARSGTETQYLKYPASWLNAEAYLDAPEQGHLALVQAGPELRTYDDYRRHAAGEQAARLLRKPYIPEPQPPGDRTHPRQWARNQAATFVQAHEHEIRTALAHQETA